MLGQQLVLTANYNKMDNKTLGKIPGKQIHQEQGLKDFLEEEKKKKKHLQIRPTILGTGSKYFTISVPTK